MTAYKLVVKPSVEKDLKPISKKVLKQIFSKIEELKSNPYPKHSIKLTGSQKQYRIHAHDYRIIYEVDS